MEFFLVVVVSALTLQITFAAIQVFHILHEVRLALQRFNRILDHTSTLATSAAKPITAVNDFFADVKDLVHQTEDQIVESTPDRVIPESRFRRFFHRSGLPLHSS